MKKVLTSSLWLTALALVFILTEMTSCTKTVTNNTVTVDTLKITVPPTYPITGLWVGTYTVSSQPSVGSQFHSFIINTDGTMIVNSKGANMQYLSTGTWSLTDSLLTSSFTCVYAASSKNLGITQRSTAIWSSSKGTLTGKWYNRPLRQFI